MKNKITSCLVLIIFTFVSIFLPFPTPTGTALAQSTGSLRVISSPVATSTKSVAKTQTPTVQSSASSQAETCSFIELLINIAVITPANANPARSALGCPVPTVAPVTVVTQPITSSSETCDFIELLINIAVITPANANPARNALGCKAPTGTPSVDLKVNGSNGPITVSAGSKITLSWKSTDTVSCNDGLNLLPTSGKVYLIANTALSYPMACTGTNGNSVVDSVVVLISGSSSDDSWDDQSADVSTSSIAILGVSLVPGYDYVDVSLSTNVATRLIMTYTDTPAATSSVKTFESATTTTHQDRITGLKPNTTYYLAMALISKNNGSVVSSDGFVFTTLSTQGQNTATSTASGQKVLSSAGGLGVVTVAESESLKTKSQMTLEAWVKPTSWNTTLGMSKTTDSVIISKGNIGGNIDYALSLDNGKLVYSNNDSTLFTCSSVAPLNQWTHVAVSINESTQNISLYVNGVKQSSICEGAKGVFNKTAKINKAKAITEAVPGQTTATSTATVADTNTSATDSTTDSSGWGSSYTESPTVSDSISTYANARSNVYFGNFYPKSCGTDFAGNGFIGLIDDIRIWNISRTDAQIKTDLATTTTTATSSYAALLPSFSNPPSGLVGHWSFDDEQANDLTYNFNNGALKGDMEIVSDDTAKSDIMNSSYTASSFDYSYPESCDSAIEEPEDVLSGYEIAFKGGVKSVASSGQYTDVTLETCDNPKEDLVKSVSAIGAAPAKSASYFNSLGTIIVTIGEGLGMKIPKEKDTISGTAVDYITQPGASQTTSATKSANSIGYASNWTPVANSCMKPKGGLLGSSGTFMVVGAVVAVVVIAVVCTGCLAAMTALLPGGVAAGAPTVSLIGVGTLGASTGAAAMTSASVYAGATTAGSIAAAGYTGSRMKCDKNDLGCF